MIKRIFFYISKILYFLLLPVFLSIFLFSLTLNNFNKKYKNHIDKNVSILQGKTMGTYWQVKFRSLRLINKEKIKYLIQKLLDKDENMLSPWKKKSLVSKFNKCKKKTPQLISNDFFKILKMAFCINKKTQGKLDITTGSLIDIWGFGIRKKPSRFPSLYKIKKNMNLIGNQHLKLFQNSNGKFLEKDIDSIKINLSSLGEGFAVDHLSNLLQKQGIENYTISVGGAVLVKIKNLREPPKIIAIQKPTDQENAIQLILYLKNHAISTAGSYRNYYRLNGKKISHIIDPFTGFPIKHNLVSVSVIAKTALEADGWDTGLLTLGFEKAKKIILKEKLAACLIIKEKKSFLTWISPHFKKFLI
ncbi:FAD:protein FMN transferase ApbE [Buchnera aphidicola (Muscaphis stroyani)]|uniref:FAD:protein FMN transferase n=1 Tax=Buchnera aphidicola (Muscaphis stroyani) TaxID=1241869 RepID=A0A4D6Y4F8_9GAMM|nr:FAD:protein FMN transferase [Buchnera aphidicola]QCI24312.1 FAD:protein FMN transferase ApbE [Buchnera aphidicola (Muscaphis stroyani)]